MIKKIKRYIEHFLFNTKQYFDIKFPINLHILNYFNLLFEPKYFKVKQIKYDINLKNNDKKEIPKNIFLCYKNKNIPNTIIEDIQNLNKDWNITFYDDEECGNFIKKYYDDELYNLFLKIKDGPIRADLFRICILNKYGGVYTDIDNKFKYPLEDILENNATFVIGGSYIPGQLNPAFIASTPKNPILENTIDLYKNIISKEKYSYWNYSIVYALTYTLNQHIEIINESKFIKLKEKILDQ